MIGSGVTGAEFASAYLADGRPGDAGLQPRPGDAARGRRRGDGDRARCSASRGMTILNNSRAPVGPASRRRRRGRRWPTAAVVAGSHALMAVGSVPNTGDLGLAEYGVEVGPGGLRDGRPGLPHQRARHLRGRRLHRRAAAGQRGRDAGPDRDVARARRGGRAAAAQDRGGQRVHRPRAGQRRASPRPTWTAAGCRPAR